MLSHLSGRPPVGGYFAAQGHVVVGSLKLLEDENECRSIEFRAGGVVLTFLSVESSDGGLLCVAVWLACWHREAFEGRDEGRLSTLEQRIS